MFRISSRLVVSLLLSVAALWSQDSRGTLLGQVTDASGAGVPGAQVKITNTATAVAASAATNENGRYFLPYLVGGTYSVSVEQAGFKKFTREGVQIRIGDTVELNIALQVGDVSESVQVTAETPLLSTADSSLGQVVDERRLVELPLFAGNAMDLVHLAPGTVNGTDLRLRKAPFNNAPSQFSTDGGGNYQNEFTIDGVSNTYSDGESPRVAFSPPQTVIAEFKVQTSSFDASTGPHAWVGGKHQHEIGREWITWRGALVASQFRVRAPTIFRIERIRRCRYIRQSLRDLGRRTDHSSEDLQRA